MKRNGFIATSVLYSFFLIFITLFVALIMNYLHNQVLISKIDEESWNFLMTINNTKLSDLNVGDRINFTTKGDNPVINEDASWILSYVSGTKYYFLSDLDAQNVDVTVQLSKDTFPKVHPMTVDVFNELKSNGTYQNTFEFPNKTVNGKYTGYSIEIPTTSVLKAIRNQNIDNNIKDAIFGVTGGYLVYHDDPYNTAYTTGAYYENRVYSFSLKDEQLSLVKPYCGGYYDGTTLYYNDNNTFGYINIVKETIKNVKYVDYCTYASPVKYTHDPKDLVVDQAESAESDKILTTYSSLYTIRLMAVIDISQYSSESIYIAGGKGTMMDPYIMTNGVKQS